jgi:hypothetical protein
MLFCSTSLSFFAEITHPLTGVVYELGNIEQPHHGIISAVCILLQCSFKVLTHV